MMSESQQNPTVQKERGHTLAVRDRGQITVSGVSEVLSFDEANVRLVTTCGILNLEGQTLRIHVLNTADGVVAVTGKLNAPDLYTVMQILGEAQTRDRIENTINSL